MLIEAKIGAMEGDGQLEKYEEENRRKARLKGSVVSSSFGRAILKFKHAEIGTDLSAEWERGDIVFKEVPEEVYDLEADALITAAVAPLEALTRDELEKIFKLAPP